jgi:hypothetical protein
MRQSAAMSSRRPVRPSQVRPRPPSSGRPGPSQPRPRAAAPGRIPTTRPKPARHGLPLLARLFLAASVAVLVGAVLLTGAGQLGGVVGALGTAVGGFVDRVAATPLPSETPTPLLTAPTLAKPAHQWTSQPTVTLTGTIPAAFAGDGEHSVRLYVTLPDGAPSEVKEIAVPATAAFSIPGVPLVIGPNDFSVTLVGPGGESEPSATVTYVLDTEAPVVKVASPKDGATVNRAAAEITGTTQALSGLVARNEANGSTATATAAVDGSFSLQVPIADGPNGITITATDPAGNAGSAVVTIRRGSGKLTADVSASSYRIKKSALPEPLTVKVVVTDPDGRPLEGAAVLFTLTVPGIPAIVPSEVSTDGAGIASFRTTIPAAATPGTGPITALVTTRDFGSLTVRTVLTIAP